LAAGVAPVLTFLRRSVTLWVGTIFIVAGTAAALMSFGEWRDAQRFRREAVPARAIVTAKSIESASRENRTSTRYLVTYRFAASDGGTLDQTEEVPVDDWEQLVEGDSLDVSYVPSDPSTARARAAGPWWIPLLVTGLTALVALVGVAIALPGGRRALLIFRVHRNGVETAATVVDVGPAGVTVNRVAQWRLRYDFRDQDGREHSGESDLLAPQEAVEWRNGDRGAVLYDRNRPSDSVWLGKT
jgi:Protein of unknown function (DUF3592)